MEWEEQRAGKPEGPEGEPGHVGQAKRRRTATKMGGRPVARSQGASLSTSQQQAEAELALMRTDRAEESRGGVRVVVAAAGWRAEVEVSKELTLKELMEAVETESGVSVEGMKIMVEGEEVKEAKKEEAGWKEAVREGAVVRVVETECSSGQPHLHNLAKRGRERAVAALLRRGGDPMSRDRQANTALHWAAWSGSWTVVMTLVAAGVRLEERDHLGNTALTDAMGTMALEDGAQMKVEALLCHGADVNAEGFCKWRPVHRAVAVMDDKCERARETLRVVVASGADVHAKDEYRNTALMGATTRKKEWFMEELRRAGARE